MRVFYFSALGLLGVAAGVLAVVACTPGDDCDFGDCTSAASGSDSGPNGDGSNVDGNVPVPEGCDPAAEPKDAPKCVVNEFGVFVDGSSGNDSGAGTKEAPFKTIGGALGKLAGKQRVYVCEGTYAEKVKVSSAVSIYGGWACGGWSYSGNKAKVAPTQTGYALHVENVAGDVAFSDVAFTALAGTVDAPSSIAAFVSGSPKVSFLRAELTAGAGFKGADGAAGTTGTITAVSNGGMNANGNPASGETAGVQKICTCTGGNTTKGGGGGAPGGMGVTGEPDAGTPDGGQGGKGNTNCGGGGLGATGGDAKDGSSGNTPTTVGALTASKWEPAGGADGATGVPGQGGGGGGGRDGSSAGGGGACGGCGGSGGRGGSGGGGSVALLAFESAVRLRASTLATSSGGAAGKGGAGGAGAVGGTGGVGNCLGGDGGNGGSGGSGSGGAGGVSVGVLFKNGAPSLEGTTVTTGTAGAKGEGGSPGVNDGIDGVKADTLEAP